MSTIERAMRKLSGDSEPSFKPDVADEVTLENEQGTPAETLGKPPVQAEAPAAAKNVDEEKKFEQAEMPAAEKNPQPNRSPSTSKRYVELDFNWLKTMGFLVPGDSSVRLSEEYQTIKRHLIANTVSGMLATKAPKNLIMVTSSVPSEGKTYTSMNLALSIALEVERTVLLVDVDIMKSDLSKLFGVANRTGLYDVLGHPDLGVEDVMYRTNVPSLTLLPAGTIRKQVTENLAGQAMFDLTREIAARYPDRLVIFDCPPVLATSSANALAPLVGQIMLVVESCKTTRQTLNHALSVMGDIPITGLLLNKVRHRGVSNSGYYGYGYEYGYGYGYGHRSTSDSG